MIDGGSEVSSPTERHFTGKERDTESGNDYFEAHYYSSTANRLRESYWKVHAPITVSA
jgi:hypothetical protein